MKIPLKFATLSLAIASALHAQQPPAIPQQAPQEPQGPITTLKLGTSLVGVSAVVLDPRGEPVKDLTRDDFMLKQDGKEQPIRYFSQDSTLPLTLALMVDTSSSQKAFIQEEIMASEKFFRVMLTRPADRAVLVQFDYTILQLQKMTDQVQTLENALSFLSLQHSAGGGLGSGHGGTLLYDSIVSASQLVLDKERGRRAMVILTDGEDNGSRNTLEQAVAAAQRADIVVYSVLYSTAESGFSSGLHPPGNHSVARRQATTYSINFPTPPEATSSPSAGRCRST